MTEERLSEAQSVPTLTNPSDIPLQWLIPFTLSLFLCPSLLQVDYEVCHDVLVSYLESFDTYANFK